MQHHHNVGAERQSRLVAGFLVAAVPFVPVVTDDMLDAEFFAHLHGAIVRTVVHQHHLIHDVERNLAVGLFEGVGGVVGR